MNLNQNGEIMKIKSIVGLPLAAAVVLSTSSGCVSSYGDYAKAVQEANITTQLAMEQAAAAREARRNQHQREMTALMMEGMKNIPKGDTTTAVLLPTLFGVMTDRYGMMEMATQLQQKPAAQQAIAAPASIGDEIAKVAGAIVPIAGYGAAAYGMKAIASVGKAAIAAGGTHVTGEGAMMVSDSEVGDVTPGTKSVSTITKAVEPETKEPETKEPETKEPETKEPETKEPETK
jgi:hypothetical protein